MDAALVILDGWGLGDADSEHRDAIAAADTPTFEGLTQQGATSTLKTSGRAVGLPEGQMGNSEVGHLTIGAGRMMDQAYTRITHAAEDGRLASNDAIEAAFEHAEDTGGRIRFMGLVSDGGVHAHQAHLHALLEAAADYGVEAVTHAFTDGRDTPPKSGAGYLAELESVVEECGTGEVATVSGRYYAMDRDRNWERTRKAYDAIVARESPHNAESAVEAVEKSYDRGDTDEFVEPTLVDGGPASENDSPALEDGDAVVFCNFRADRARQLVRMLTGTNPEWEFEINPPEIELVTMTEYDATFPFPVAFAPHQPEDTFGEVLAREGKTQLRIAESEKYPHVTYFLNGGREVEFDGEIRRIVDSPDVPTYDRQPEMSARKLTDTALEVIDAHDPDAMVLNYANPDMVGHTGDFAAAVSACEAVDEQLERLVARCRAAGAGILVTADHGNADDMGTPDDPDTAHTLNPVPVVYLAPENSEGTETLRDGGELSDIAPTLLPLLGIETPDAMSGETLVETS